MSTTPVIRRARRALGAVAVGGFASLALASSASAHVSIAEGEVTAGSYALLTFGVPHGCEGSPTTVVRIQMPASIPQVTPTVDANWDVSKVMAPLDAPIDAGHGEQITERVSEVVYTAKTPLPDGYRQAFVLSLKVPDDAAGTLAFPTIQTCETGETAWIEQPTAGGEEPEHPAPTVAVVAAEDGSTAEPAALVEDAPAVAATTDDDGDGAATGLAIAGLVAGVAGLGIGGVALARSRRR
jgi:uncharacterized protein YcnI